MRYAAIDIGSNSIRMLAAEVVPDEPPRILAAQRQVTRLGESVFRTGRFSQEVIDFACGVLSRMAAHYRDLGVVAVRAVATSSARDARNQAEFVERASQVIGVPVEVISGREEARLIHLGVQSRWPHPNKNLVVIDIGGGSMEVIAGEDGHFRDAVSKPLGAVRLRELLVDADPPSPDDLRRLLDYIDERLSRLPQWFSRTKWDRAIATSGTASAAVCAVNRVSITRRESADRLRASVADIRKLYMKLSQMDV